MAKTKTDLLQGTLDMMLLKVLALEPMHGYGISQRLEQISDGAFQVNPGSFFPALYRLEEEGLVCGEWGRSENNRRAKFYRLTADGRRRLEQETRDWTRMTEAIGRVLTMTEESP